MSPIPPYTPGGGAGAQAIVDAAITDLIGGAPGVLDTLGEISSSLADDASFATHVGDLVGAVQQNMTEQVDDPSVFGWPVTQGLSFRRSGSIIGMGIAPRYLTAAGASAARTAGAGDRAGAALIHPHFSDYQGRSSLLTFMVWVKATGVAPIPSAVMVIEHVDAYGADGSMIYGPALEVPAPGPVTESPQLLTAEIDTSAFSPSEWLVTFRDDSGSGAVMFADLLAFGRRVNT